MANKTFSFFDRVMRFRRELGVLWRAFLAPETPLPLKGLMLLVPIYLLSPIDLLPDFLPFFGWIDDVVIVPMLVSWIVGMLPRRAHAARDDGGARYRESDARTTIDATYRRR